MTRARTVGLLDAVNLRDVRVIKRRQRLRFARESRQALHIGGEQVRQHLDRGFAVQFCVAVAIDLAHAAGAEWSHNFVRAQQGPKTK